MTITEPALESAVPDSAMEILVHPAATRLAPLSPAEYFALVSAVELDGWDDASSLTLAPDGRLLDGLHRWRAAQECGIAWDDIPKVRLGERWIGRELEWVLTRHLGRRSLTAGQRAAAADLLSAGSKVGRPPVPEKPAEVPNLTIPDAADQADVSERTVREVRHLRETAADPDAPAEVREVAAEQYDQVTAGDTTVHKAAQTVAVHEHAHSDDPVVADAATDAAEKLNAGEISATEAVAEVKEAKTRSAPNYLNPDGTRKHCAKFTAAELDTVRVLLGHSNGQRLLDPFAGTGGVHALTDRGYRTVGIELEPEWADQHERTRVGNSRDLAKLGFADECCNVVVTSPAYGNRMADNDVAGPHRGHVRNYATYLGRSLTEGSGASLGFTEAEYEELHQAVWSECVRILVPGGRFVLVCKDFVHAGVAHMPTGWHVNTLLALGLTLLTATAPAPSRDAADMVPNGTLLGATVVLMQKPGYTPPAAE